MSVNEKLLNAFSDYVQTSIIKKAGYDKTIQAKVLSCEDATIGKYRCRYQDATIYAYSNNTDITYEKNAYVYILVPNGDMKNDKTILGTTNKLGVNYISQAYGDQAYNIIGNNCIVSDDKFYLNTINKDYKYILYKYNITDEVNLNTTALEEYLKQSSSLIVGATFKTSISSNKQYRGHYGITYNLRFMDNTSNREVIRSYTVDEDNMIDNPYRLAYDTRQYQIFDIDGANFIRVESIEIFNKDFPNATGIETNVRLLSGDIEISKLEICGAVRMSDAQINGLAISFYTPQGTFFTDSDTSGSYRTITAQVRIKGKLASSDQGLSFYWGQENVSITPSSEYYNKHLGRGWKCVNDKNVIAAATETSDPVVEWTPGKSIYTIKMSEATARDNNLKVAVVYNENVVTKVINIKNLSANIPDLTIESNSGTKFYHDIGHPTLTCKVNNVEQNGYTYYWAYESNAGILQQLPETTEENANYDDAVAALNQLNAEIAAGTKFANKQAQNLINLETNVKAFNFIQRVRANKIYDVQINNITNFGTFKCSVYNNDTYLGTTSIVLFNSLENQDIYSLVINNGAAVFQYDENGIAPTSTSLDVPQTLQTLSFTIYDNLGNPIDEKIIANPYNCQSRWEFPIKNTMLEQKSENNPNSGISPDGNYYYYDNKISLIYGIASRYDIQKQLNQIKLTVDYKGMHLTAQTNFTFAKQGEPGTNGTQYLVKLIPNTQMSNLPLYPMITKAGSDYILNYGLNSTANETIITNNNGYQLFKAQLWHSGTLVWEGASSSQAAIDGISKPSSVKWSVLKNKYKQDLQDASAFDIKNEDTGLISYKQDYLESQFNKNFANIIKCTIIWQDKEYYGTIPIITAWTANSNYRVNLADYSGFKYVVYTNDGMSPQYDSSHPFEFICKQKIDSVWEDVSNVEGSHKITYSPGGGGSIMNVEDDQEYPVNILELLNNAFYRRTGLKDNQWEYRPISKYNGECVNAHVSCAYSQNSTVVGKIYIPIHFLLNKYGLANLNGWDGNHIEINDQGGYILAPQMGAGRKENDYSFTGVIMGQVKNPTKYKSNVGLFGYDHGTQSFFLNSENGAAIFGKTGSGQIIVDPQFSKAYLYSSDFWIDYDEDTGLPSSYSSSNEHVGYGLLIDLTTPLIKFGNGKFYVDSDTFNVGGQDGITYDRTADKVTFGNNVVLEWSNIEDADNHVPSTQDIETISTRITKNTITTQYLQTNQIYSYGASVEWLNAQTITATYIVADASISTPILAGGSFQISKDGIANNFQITYSYTDAPGFQYWEWDPLDGLIPSVNQAGMTNQIIFSDGFKVQGGVTINDTLQILNQLHVVNNGYIKNIYTKNINAASINATSINANVITRQISYDGQNTEIEILNPFTMTNTRAFYKVVCTDNLGEKAHQGSLFANGSSGRFGIYDNTTGDWMIYMTNDISSAITKRIYMPFVYSATVSGEAANVYVGSSGGLYRISSSSKRYKHSIENLIDYKKILNIPVVSFIYNQDYLSKEDVNYNKRVPGFIAEDVYQNYPIAACFNQDGTIEDWNFRFIIPPMLAVEQDHENQIQQLRQQINDLKLSIKEIKGEK